MAATTAFSQHFKAQEFLQWVCTTIMHVPVQISFCSMGYREGKEIPHTCFPDLLLSSPQRSSLLKTSLYSTYKHLLKSEECDKPSGDLLAESFLNSFSADTEVKAGYWSQCRLWNNYLIEKLPGKYYSHQTAWYEIDLCKINRKKVLKEIM